MNGEVRLMRKKLTLGEWIRLGLMFAVVIALCSWIVKGLRPRESSRVVMPKTYYTVALTGAFQKAELGEIYVKSKSLPDRGSMVWRIQGNHWIVVPWGDTGLRLVVWSTPGSAMRVTVDNPQVRGKGRVRTSKRFDVVTEVTVVHVDITREGEVKIY